MKKLQLLSRTIDDKLIKDSLCAVGTLSSNGSTTGQYMVVGGIAAQSYIPSEHRRPTADVDVSVLRPLNYEDFRNFSKTVKEYLEDHGYEVDTKKSGSSFALEVSNPKELSELLWVEFVRRNPKNFEVHKKRLEREMGNSRTKRVEGTESTYIVKAPEDIVLPKLARGVGALERNGYLNNYLDAIEKSYDNEKIKKRLDAIRAKRREAIINVGNPLISEELRFMSDIYDVWLLAGFAGFNENTIMEGSLDWNVLTKDTQESNKMRVLLNGLL